jgi:uncharacterized protein (DUF1778 family)
MDKDIHIRIDDAQYQAIERAAKAQGLSVSAFIRQASLLAAGKVK